MGVCICVCCMEVRKFDIEFSLGHKLINSRGRLETKYPSSQFRTLSTVSWLGIYGNMQS